ncbi:MAG: hypothetical protein ACYC3G_00670 [Minisyncoccota bacterium]
MFDDFGDYMREHNLRYWGEEYPLEQRIRSDNPTINGVEEPPFEPDAQGPDREK